MPRVLRLPILIAMVATFIIACAAPAAPPTATTAPVPTATAAPPTSVPATPTSAAAASSAGAVNVFAASSLTASFTALGKSFQTANPGTTVTFNFGGSNDLAAQIGKGAPADVFASANEAQMAVVVKSGQVAANTSHDFVRNRLVVIYPAANPGKVAKLQDLATSGTKVVLAAKAVPVGQYALDFLNKANADPAYGSTYSASVTANVVSYETDVKAVLNKVALGEADAGIVYTTDITGDSASKVGRIDIPDNLNTVAVYPIAVVKTSSQAAVAQKFVDYVLSADGQKLLASYGFIPVTPAQ